MAANARRMHGGAEVARDARGYNAFELPRLCAADEKSPQVSGHRWTPPGMPSNGERARLGSGAPGSGASAEDADAAYHRGVSEGMRQGTMSATQQTASAVEALHKALELFNSSQEHLLRERERDLHALAVAVAQKILQREVTTDPRVVEELVCKALELLPADTTLEIRLHPADLQVVRGLPGAPGEIAASSHGMRIEWTADPALERGSFLMESPMRLINGRADVALRELYERMDHNA